MLQIKHPQRHPNRTSTLVFCLKTSYFFLKGCFVVECLFHYETTVQVIGINRLRSVIGINRFFHSILDRYSGLAVLPCRTCCSQELEGKLTKDTPVKLRASQTHTATLF